MYYFLNGKKFNYYNNIYLKDIILDDPDFIIVNGIFVKDLSYKINPGDHIFSIKKENIDLDILQNIFYSRYSKNLIDKISSVSIGIAGLGGIGSNVAITLTRLGFNNFTLVDYDIVEPTNLNRQCYFLEDLGREKVFALSKHIKDINPNVNLHLVYKKIESSALLKDIFKKNDFVVEAFDNKDYKQFIFQEFPNIYPNKYLIGVSGIAGYSNFDNIKIYKINNYLYIVGDLYSEVNNENILFLPKINIAVSKIISIIWNSILD